MSPTSAVRFEGHPGRLVGCMLLLITTVFCGACERPDRAPAQKAAEAAGTEEQSADPSRPADGDPPAEPAPAIVPAPEVIPGFTKRRRNRQQMQEYLHDRTGLIFVWIPGGTFLMGSPGKGTVKSRSQPQHEVTLSPFLIAKYEVTQEAWERVMGTSPSHFRNKSNPVERVSWTDAAAFCGEDLELPTEAQWEFACRGGSKKPRPMLPIRDAWILSNSHGKAHRVGTKKPNQLGLYDMLGNVWEWCRNWTYRYRVEAAVDPEGPPRGKLRALRGGSWTHTHADARPTVRRAYAPDYCDDRVGFRPALSLDRHLETRNTTPGSR